MVVFDKNVLLSFGNFDFWRKFRKIRKSYTRWNFQNFRTKLRKLNFDQIWENIRKFQKNIIKIILRFIRIFGKHYRQPHGSYYKKLQNRVIIYNNSQVSHVGHVPSDLPNYFLSSQPKNIGRIKTSVITLIIISLAQQGKLIFERILNQVI